MVEIVLNEKVFAENVIANRNLGKNPVATLGCVARYYSYLGYNKGDIYKLLEKLMIQCDPTVNIVKWQDTLERIAKQADKYKLIMLDGVDITECELEYIDKLESVMQKRLMFTLLCLAKYGNAINPLNNDWVNKKDSDIFSLANVKVTTKKQSLMLNDLWRIGYIGFSRIVDNININVKIINEDSPVVLSVSDFRNLGNQIMVYYGFEYITCVSCGAVVKPHGKRQRYCKECSLKVNRQRTLEKYHLHVPDSDFLVS